MMHRAIFFAAVLLLATRPVDAQSPDPAFSRTDALEVSAVAATGAGHLVFSELDLSRWFIPLAGLSWGGYFYHKHRTVHRFLPRLGLTPDGFGPALRDASLVALSSTAAMAGYATWQNQLRLHRDMVWLFLLYPTWGLLQQMLTQGMGTTNLRKMRGPLGSPLAVTLASASLFGAVHVPNWKLVGATTALGLLFTPLYLKHRNLWPLGLYHGWLGGLFYFWVLDDNPWREIILQSNDSAKIEAGWIPGPGGRPAIHVQVSF